MLPSYQARGQCDNIPNMPLLDSLRQLLQALGKTIATFFYHWVNTILCFACASRWNHNKVIQSLLRSKSANIHKD